jgi:hypothetical protein
MTQISFSNQQLDVTSFSEASTLGIREIHPHPMAAIASRRTY